MSDPGHRESILRRAGGGLVMLAIESLAVVALAAAALLVAVITLGIL